MKDTFNHKHTQILQPQPPTTCHWIFTRFFTFSHLYPRPRQIYHWHVKSPPPPPRQSSFLLHCHFCNYYNCTVRAALPVEVAKSDKASALGVQRQAQNGECHGHFTIAWHGTADNAAAHLTLYIDDGTAVTFNGWTTAAAWKTWRTRLATNFHVQAAETNLARTAQTISCFITTAVDTT